MVCWNRLRGSSKGVIGQNAEIPRKRSFFCTSRIRRPQRTTELSRPPNELHLSPDKDQPPATVYQLKVALCDISPMIWRRLLVTSHTTIAQLHAILQMAMGWEDLHLHQFRVYGKAYGIHREGGMCFDDDPYRVTLASFKLRAGEHFVYEYDMGDFWQHDIRLERVLPLDPSKPYPLCTGGAGDCPPEDCGGPGGYRHLIEERCSWEELEQAREDLGLVAQRLLAFTEGGPRPTEEDIEFMDALERMHDRLEDVPTAFSRRTVNAAFRTMSKETLCTSASK